jgi:hypothetical protein
MALVSANTVVDPELRMDLSSQRSDVPCGEASVPLSYTEPEVGTGIAPLAGREASHSGRRLDRAGSAE